MDKISEFVRKNRVVKDTLPKVEIKEVKVPWYRRPLNRDEFTSRKGHDGKVYVQHNEWSKTVWIGPYKDNKEADEIIDSYVTESLKTTSLDKKANEMIHSIIVENDNEFFKT